jgi:hypothetical protein
VAGNGERECLKKLEIGTFVVITNNLMVNQQPSRIEKCGRFND